MNENSKVKALFFAQYWGQEILKYENSVGDKFWDKQVYPVDGHNLTCSGLQAHLRAVDQLTDEELFTLIHIHGFEYGEFEYVRHETGIEVNNSDEVFQLAYNFFDINYCGETDGTKLIASYDYLRSIGILLPFTYIDENSKPQTLQPDEIVQRGWAKIKENGN